MNRYKRFFDEAIEKDKVVRQGQKKIVKKSTKPGYKIVGGKEVKMSGQELIHRKKAGVKSAKKAKPKQHQADTKRKKSIARRPEGIEMEKYVSIFTEAYQRKNMQSTAGLVNKKMNDDVYKLRRQVIDIIYDASKLVGERLPRVDVRITEDPVDEVLKKDVSRILGLARTGDRKIWIPENTILSGYNLRYVVFHELVHAIFGFSHFENNILMCSVYKKEATQQQIDKAFIAFYKKWKESE